jgi:amino acid transporter
VELRHFALFFCAIASIGLVLSGSFDTLIAIGSVLYVAVYLSGFASLLILRRREPDLPRPYKAWCYPWSTALVLLASAAFLLGSVIGDLKHSLFTAILILSELCCFDPDRTRERPPTRLTITRSPSSFNESNVQVFGIAV